MSRHIVLLLVSLGLALAPVRGLACAGHLTIDPDKLGFFGGMAARMAGLAPPEPVFELDYEGMAKSEIGEKAEVG